MSKIKYATFDNVNLLRIAAILLIVNSHLSSLYPFSALSYGGHLGNSIFYLISGYGLASSYRINPLPVFGWLRKRFIKIVLPLIFILFVINIGTWDSLKAAIWGHLIWHEKGQLNSFLPVLFVLYALFLPLIKMKIPYFKALLVALLMVAVALFFHRARSLDAVPHDLLIQDYFFSINALICFMLGIHLSRSISLDGKWNDGTHRGLLLLLFVLLQASHKIVLLYFPAALIVNFFSNVLSLIVLFILFTSLKLKLSERFSSLVADLSGCSLAVYLIHSKIIKIEKAAMVEWPYNVIIVFVYSFILAYPLMKIGNFLGARLLSAIPGGNDRSSER